MSTGKKRPGRGAGRRRPTPEAAAGTGRGQAALTSPTAKGGPAAEAAVLTIAGVMLAAWSCRARAA